MGTRLRSKVTLLFIVCAALLAVGGTAMALTTDTSGSTSPSPTISSDKADYSPGELVTLTGSGWQAGESVHIVVNDDEGQTWKRDVYVDADASGNISDSFNLPDWFVATYTVTATGTQSGVATTTFTDGTVRVRAVGTAGTQPTLNWELYNNTTCTGTPSNSNSIAAVGLAANGSDIPVNVNATQSLKLTPGSVPGHTFDNWTSGNFTTGTFTNTSNPGCIVGTGSGSSGGGAQNTQVNYNNAAPVVANQTVSTNVNTAKLITLGATDANNDTLTYEFVGPLPANGTLYKGDATNPTNQTNANKITGSTTLTGTAQVTYVPDNGFTGTNTFGFRATDQSATSTTATVTINVTSCTTPAAPVFATKSTDADGSNGWFRTIPTVSASSTSAGATITYATEVNGGTKSAYSATAPTLGQGTTKVYAKATNGTCPTSETIDTFKVDTIAPSINDDGTTQTPNGAGWFNSAVTNDFSASDATSGLADTSKADFSVSSGTNEGTAVKINSGPVSDNAGNTNSGIDSAAFKIDKTAPVVAYKSASPAANAAGWNNTNVTATFEATDSLSGMGATDAIKTATNTADTTGEGTNVSVGSPAFTDRAGNTALANTATSPDFKIDKTKPSVTVTDVSNTTYTYGDVPTPGCDTQDQPGLSGVKTNATVNVTGGNNGFGTFTATCSGAVDNADNNQAAPVSVTYGVSATFNGFLQPIDGHAVNTGKYGRTYPIKWQLRDSSGALLSDTTAQLLVGMMSGGQKAVTCGSFTLLPEDALEESTTGSTSLRYDATSDQFIYNYKAPTSGSCYIFAIRYADGLTTQQIDFKFTK